MFAYIPARGGSKRVPGKNIKTLGDRPVIAHVIETLKTLDFLSDVFVSTDDPDIAGVAEAAGATWLGPREANLADDKAGFIDLIHHDLPRHAAAAGGSEDALFVLALAALVPASVYRAAQETWLAQRPDVLMSCIEYTKSPYWALVPREDGFLEPLHKEMVYVNSQDLPPAYTDAGLFYFFNIENMKRYDSHKVVERLQAYPVDEAYAVGVDTPADWARLESRYRALQNNEGNQV